MQNCLTRSLVIAALFIVCPLHDAEAQLFKKKQPKQQAAAAAPKLAPGQFEWYPERYPERSPSGPLLLVVSIDDQIAYVYRNGVLIGQSPVDILEPQRPIPAGVFLMLEGTEPGANTVVPGRPIRPWATLSLEAEITSDVVEDFRPRLQIPSDFARRVYELAQPGTILVTTAGASTPQTSSATDFTIMRPEGR